MTFGARLKKLRTDREITQLQLSDILDTAKSNISKYEADSIEPNMAMLCKISKYFNVSVDYLLGISDDVATYGTTASNHISERSGSNLRYWISKTGMDNKEVARELGISANTLHDYLAGMTIPSEILSSLSEICKVSTDCLLGLRNVSRPCSEDGFPFKFDREISKRLKEQLKAIDIEYGMLAQVAGVDEDEIVNLFEYGFIPHMSTFIKIADYFNVSCDYLLNRTDSLIGVRRDEERLIYAFRKLNDDNKMILLGDALKEVRNQEFEEHEKFTSVAADMNLRTGTDNMGK